MCTLDVINAVAYLAFLDPDIVKEMRFHVEDLYAKRAALEAK